MKSKNSNKAGNNGATGHDANFAREVTTIIETHEKAVLPPEPPREIFSSDDAYAKRHQEYELEREGCQRELRWVRHYLLDDRPSIDYDDGEELKEMLADKLAASLPNKTRPSDWWWTPAEPWIQQILKEVQRALEKETKSKSRPWRRGLLYAWGVLSELIYLAIVIGILSAATTKFETIVFSTLVMIYNAVVGGIGGVGLGASYIAQRLEEVYGEIGRTLGLRVSTSAARKLAEPIKRAAIFSSIHNVSLAIGSLIALWHLATAILP